MFLRPWKLLEMMREDTRSFFFWGGGGIYIVRKALIGKLMKIENYKKIVDKTILSQLT